MPKYHKIPREHVEDLKQMGIDLPVVEIDGSLFLPYEKLDIYADGVWYPGFWSYLKHTKNPLRIGRSVLYMALGYIAKPLFQLISKYGSASRITNWTGLNEYNFSQSLDGKRLVFEKGRETNDVLFLRVGNAAKEQPKLERIGNDSFEKGRSSWTADGQSIVFTSNPRGNSGIFETNLKAGQTRQLVSGPDRYSMPVVTYDDKWLLYIRHPLGDTLANDDLMRMGLGGAIVPGTVRKVFLPVRSACTGLRTLRSQRKYADFHPTRSHKRARRTFSRD